MHLVSIRIPFLRTIPSFLLAGLLFCSSAAAVYADSLIYETRFNKADTLSLEGGASLGAPGSGVSGKASDRAYDGNATNLAPGAAGPAAVVTSDLVPLDGIDELTITAWYKPRAEQNPPAILYNGFGATLLWEKTNTWTLRLAAKVLNSDKQMYWFSSGGKPPLGSWMNLHEWTFIAIVWKKADNTAVFYQGDAHTTLTEAAKVKRTDVIESIKEGANPKRAIGNDWAKRDRAFNGGIDDVRFYSKALSSDTLDLIRQADLKDVPIMLP